MPSASYKASRVSEEEKYQQLQKQLEQELVRLRREYEILEHERSHSQFTGFNKLSKSSKVVNIFKAEYENILTDLDVACAAGNKQKDAVLQNKLSEILQKFNFFTEKNKTRKAYLTELEGEIKKVAKSVVMLQKQQVTERQHMSRVYTARQTLETLENKLEVQMTKFNLIVAKNAMLREQIDHLLWDRRNFMTIWDKLIDKLTTGKQILLDLIEQATIAYDQREEWCNKLQMLRLTGYKNLHSNINQMREHRRKLDNAKKLEEYFNIKGQKRIMRDLLRKEVIKRTKMKEKLEEKLESYKQMINEIKEFTKESKTEIIAHGYYNREAENFMKFKYITDLIAEMESINDNLGYMHLEVDEQRALHDCRADEQAETLDILATDFERAFQLSAEADETLQELNQNLNVTMKGIWKLFKLCKCDQDPLLKLLGDNITVEKYNVLLFLQILEKTIQQALVSVSYRDKVSEKKQKVLSNEKSQGMIYNIEKIVKADPCALCVQHEMVSDVIDRIQLPWNKQEAREKLKQRLALPDGLARVHTLSKCHLPQARRMMQQRYQ